MFWGRERERVKEGKEKGKEGKWKEKKRKEGKRKERKGTEECSKEIFQNAAQRVKNKRWET